MSAAAPEPALPVASETPAEALDSLRDAGLVGRLLERLLTLLGGRPAFRLAWRLSGADRWWRSILAAGALVAVFALDAIGQLNALLEGMHLPGHSAIGFGEVVPQFGVPSPDRAERAVSVWREHERAVESNLRDAAEPIGFLDVLDLYVAIDSLLVAPALALTLALLARRLQLVPRARAADSPLALIAVVLAWLYLLGDVAENVSMLILVRAEEWWLAYPLWAITWLKTLAFVLAALALVVAVRMAWPELRERRATVATALRRARVHAVIVAVFVGLLVGHEQLSDLIRRWDLVELGVSLGATLFLAVTVWLLAARLQQPSSASPGWQPDSALVGKVVVVAGLAQAFVHFVLGRLDDDLDYNVGWGLAIPAVFLLVVGAMSRLVPERMAGELARPDEPGARSDRIPRLLACGAVAGLALGMFHAAFGHGVYIREFQRGDLEESLAIVIAVAAGAGGALWHRRRTGRRSWWNEPLVWGSALGAVALVYVVLERDGGGEIDPQRLVLLSLLLAGASIRLFGVLAADPLAWSQRTFTGWWLVLAAAVAGVMAWVVIDVLSAGNAFGGVGTFAVAFAGAALVGGWLVWLADGTQPLPALRVLAVRRTPVLLLLVAWFLVAATLDRGGPHAVRLLQPAPAPDAVGLDELWGCWLARNGVLGQVPAGERPGVCRQAGANPALGPRPAPAAERSGVPLVLLATSGGGSRAAYWTSFVLDCLFEWDAATPDARDVQRCGPDPPQRVRRIAGFGRSDRVFAMSGVSGGAVGLASYGAYLTGKAERTDEVEPGWFDEKQDSDFLSPMVAWQLFVEGPQSLLRFRVPTDRAEVLERSWEKPWGGGGGNELARGIFELWRARRELPLILFNGTSVADGCRFNGSVFDGNVEAVAGDDVVFPDCHATGPFDEFPQPPPLERSRESALPATWDLTDFLCDRTEPADVRLSTAAILASRFPFVLPSGRLQSCELPAQDGKRLVTFVVDGGYLETTGASTLVELWNALQPQVTAFNLSAPTRCIVPFLVQVSNGYEEDAGVRETSRPLELFVPGLALGATRGGRAAQARAQAALLFDRPLGAPDATLRGAELTDRYAHLALLAHPGVRAPLGWALSEDAREDMRAQMSQDKNQAALREVRSWLADGALSCAGVGS